MKRHFYYCPFCHIPMTLQKEQPGAFWLCSQCNGRAATIAVLRKVTSPNLINKLWLSARSGHFDQNRTCPACDSKMVEIPIKVENATQSLDVCSFCQFVWFDPSEFENLPPAPFKPVKENSLSPAAREKLAMAEVNYLREQEKHFRDDSILPDKAWHWAPGLMGFPVEIDAEIPESKPLITWSLIAITIIISGLAFFNLEYAIHMFGMIPRFSWRYGGATFLTPFFLHGDFFHLLGNLYFLWIFGDNVESFLGKWRFLLLIALSTILGNIAHILLDPDSPVPVIGASGGISGVVAFYALKFPEVKLGFMIRVYWWIRWFRFKAYTMFIIWIILQFLGVAAQIYGVSNVSSIAHLGGAVVGVVFWLLSTEHFPIASNM